MKSSRSRWLQTLLAAAALTGAVVLAQADDDIPTAPKQDFAALLARANLVQQGVTEPTTEQMTLATADVQALRDQGMGWGAIANSLGLRLGAVVSAENRAEKAQTHVAAADQTSARGQGAGSSNGNGKGGGGGNGGGKGGGGGKR